MKRLIEIIRSWVENNTKITVIIIITTFLLIYTIIMIDSYYTTQKNKTSETITNITHPIKKNVSSDLSNTIEDVGELLDNTATLRKLKQLEKEFKTIAQKEHLTQQDSFRIIELYQEIKTLNDACQN